MIFVNESWNHTGNIVVYSNYHKYWLDRERRIKNPLFDVFSGKILDLKEKKGDAINYFFRLLDPEIHKGVTICVIPSSDAEKKVTGIWLLGEKLAEAGRVNKVSFLERVESIDKLAYGGSRDRNQHMRTIHPSSGMDISGEVVLLMDDVTTSGNSLYACKDILLTCGADYVEMFALGKAI